MSENKTMCYAITSGCYSDYGVERIFQSREDAEEFIIRMGGDPEQDSEYGPRIEEFEFHSAGDDLPTIYTEYWARVFPHLEQGVESGSHATTTEPVFSINTNKYYIYAQGPDRERVIKSVSDRLAAERARLEGIS